MNYSEEQNGEYEALGAIYSEEIEELSSVEECKRFSILVQALKEEDPCYVSVKIIITYVPHYPDSIPIISVCAGQNVTEEGASDLESYLISEASERLGAVMVFELVSLAQERLNEMADARRERLDCEKAEADRVSEEAEKKKFVGTPVTVESFIAWKFRFDAEMRGRTDRQQLVKSNEGKLTGRELFLTDKSMIDSDLQFLEGETAVEVDEALFGDDDIGDLSDEDDEAVLAES